VTIEFPENTTAEQRSTAGRWARGVERYQSGEITVTTDLRGDGALIVRSEGSLGGVGEVAVTRKGIVRSTTTNEVVVV
jgi:hypothetical protein